MNGHLSIILAEARLGAILDDQTLPAGWMKGLLRSQAPADRGRPGRSQRVRSPGPAALVARLADAGPDSTITGTIEAVDDRGVPVLVAFRRSGATNWTSAVAVPLADLNAPVTAALWRMAGPAAFLLLAGGLAAWFTARQVEQPLRALVRSGHRREQTGQRIVRAIARPPGGGAATHCPRTARLDGAAPRGGEPGARKPRGNGRRNPGGRARPSRRSRGLLTEALRELRIFTYLLHPPNLANDGLQATLRDFAEGFAGRTGLVARIRIPEEVDDLPPELQRAILRVVQEALTNVHRHADASHVSVNARIHVRTADRPHSRQRAWDDWRGPARRTDPARRRRRRACGPAWSSSAASLKIRTGRGGTCVLAMRPNLVALAGHRQAPDACGCRGCRAGPEADGEASS